MSTTTTQREAPGLCDAAGALREACNYFDWLGDMLEPVRSGPRLRVWIARTCGHDASVADPSRTGHPADVAAWIARRIRERWPEDDWTGWAVSIERTDRTDASGFYEVAAVVPLGETVPGAADHASLPPTLPRSASCWKCDGEPLDWPPARPDGPWGDVGASRPPRTRRDPETRSTALKRRFRGIPAESEAHGATERP